MNIRDEYHEGSQTIEPLAIDTTSSKSVVYLRRNIEQITRKDEQSGATIKLWAYEEAQLTLPEYEVYKTEAAAELAAKVASDNLSLMDAVAESYELSAQVQESQLTIMTAIADLYDLIAELQPTV